MRASDCGESPYRQVGHSTYIGVFLIADEERMQNANHPESVGRVVGLWRYPVKSMRGEALTEAAVSWHGFEGDRRWAFVRDDVPRSGFPWLTIRQRPDMRDFVPYFVDPSRPNQSRTMVRTPSGTVFDVTDPRLPNELSAGGVRVIRQDRGIFDTFPLSLITRGTIVQLAETSGVELRTERFRPNILIETTDGVPFAEDDWVSRVLEIGTLRMRVDKRDSRCVVVNVNPDTGLQEPEVLRAVVSDRDGCLGVYGSTVVPGTVSVGDEVLLRDY